jgi:hypothetical protein
MIGLRANSDIAYESDKKSGYFHELWNLYIQIIEHQQPNRQGKRTAGTEAELSFKLLTHPRSHSSQVFKLWLHAYQKQRQPFTGAWWGWSGISPSNMGHDGDIKRRIIYIYIYANQLVSILILHPHVFTLHACWAAPCLPFHLDSSQPNIPSRCVKKFDSACFLKI